MKKLTLSLFISLCFIMLSGCNFNLSENKYLNKPDIEKYDNYLAISGAYLNDDTEYINIYRQDFSTENQKAPIYNIAIIYSNSSKKQTFLYKDYNIAWGKKYRYYIRFTDKDGSKNRTEWSDAIQNTNDSLKNLGTNSYQYTISSEAIYTYNNENFTLKLADGQEFLPPTFEDYAVSYKPALVFQSGAKTLAFEVSDYKNIDLVKLFPADFYNNDVKLLGIIAQKKVYSEDKKPVLQNIVWTELQSLTVKGTSQNPVENNTFRIQANLTDNGFDYSSESDND